MVVLTFRLATKNRCRTPGLSGDEFSRPDHIFDGLWSPVRPEGHTLGVEMHDIVIGVLLSGLYLRLFV